jgi:hypothetical protein
MDYFDGKVAHNEETDEWLVAGERSTRARICGRFM